ncbi:hypothetical protein [Sporolactobacillus terrae]|nr:hypothetical protein [Sporolactobacillus terrae]UAK17621.1 hypothetical protein K7399_06770 [Sporolactobacillus terrae]
MNKKTIKSEEAKKKGGKIVPIIAIICAVDVVATLIYYYASGSFNF